MTIPLLIYFLTYFEGDFPSANGLIAPGMCFPVTVKFSPQTLEDYDDNLEVFIKYGQSCLIQ